MQQLRYSLISGESLPPIEGPRLSPFKHRSEPIEFLDVLGVHRNEDGDESPGGAHAHVFRVRIKGTIYALKVFKFYDVKEARRRNYPHQNTKIDNFTLAYQSDPFFAECRAYGRIQEIQQKLQVKKKGRAIDNLAVPCYGFVSLPSVLYEETFRTRFRITQWNRRDLDSQQPLAKRESFRAIVKKYMEPQDAIVDPKRMLSGLKMLRKGGIYQRDICARNYLGGLLVDFSIAWTTPHWSSEAFRGASLTREKNVELYDFDRMIGDEGIKTTVRAARDEDTYEKLRPLKSRALNKTIR